MMIATLLLSALFAGATPAGDGGALEGTVRAAESGAAVAGAAVRLPELGRAATTDARGRFVLADVPPGTWRVRASAAGFQPMEIVAQVPEGGTVRLDLELEARPVALEPLEVTGTASPSRAADVVGPGAARLAPRDLKSTPALAEADVLRAVQLLPSVQAASDFSSALYVRGGSQDQNLVLLDGAPLFNPYHLGGLFGAIDPDAVAAVDVLPGAFPARLGDRLSSAIDIRTRDGSRDRVHGSGAIGLISSRAGIDGPLPGGRGSYLFSARRTYLDLISNAAHRLDLIGGTLPYRFTDAYLKLSHDVGEQGRVSALFYADRERFYVPDPLDEVGQGDFAWGSYLASLNVRQQLTPTLTADARLGISTFDGSFLATDRHRGFEEEDSTYTVLDARTDVRDAFAGLDFTWYGTNQRTLAGVQVDRYLFDHDISVPAPDAFSGTIQDLRRRDTPTTLAGYLEREWQRETVQVRAGMRVLHAAEYGTAWLPRVGVRYDLTPELGITAGAGRYAQVMQSLRNEESLASKLVAYDFLGATPPEWGFATAEDVTLGLGWTGERSSVRADLFAKRMHDLPLAPLPDNQLEAPLLAGEGFRRAEQRAQGLELLARHTRGGAALTLAYSLSFAELRTDGERYTPGYHRRHTADLMAVLPWGRSGEFSARVALASGQPHTAILARREPYDYDPATESWIGSGGSASGFILGEHNAARLPGYFRLDVGARRSYHPRWFGREMTVTPYFQVLNATNNGNVLVAAPEGFSFGQPRISYVPQLPVFPTFGVEWSF